VVIVPFLSRHVRTAPARYPRAIKTVAEDIPQIVLHKTEIPPDLDSELKVSERQEMERLLYVALTRAKHTLVLALDRKLFATGNGEIHKDSQIKWLRCDRGGCNEQTFAAVSTEAQKCAATAVQQRKSRARLESAKQTQPVAISLVSLVEARKRAANFIYTLNPSGFSADEGRLAAAGVDTWGETDGTLKPPVLVTPAKRYGGWWHDFIQQIPWNADAGSWEGIFEASRPLSPDMARSVREWKLLRDYCSSGADFRRQFKDRQFLAHPEMPFYWQMDANTCLEGVVDLALFDLAGQKWLILDWKTDRVPPDKIDILCRRYRPQIAAYWKAILEMTGMKVEAAIYSTPTAKFVIYDKDELAREWTRLETLPPNQFTRTALSHHVETPVQMEFAALSDHARRG
jgi:ATP-dependent exoDNAse (exonuclease V) beta subunit